MARIKANIDVSPEQLVRVCEPYEHTTTTSVEICGYVNFESRLFEVIEVQYLHSLRYLENYYLYDRELNSGIEFLDKNCTGRRLIYFLFLKSISS
jgi:hypothetical protein